MFINSYLDSIGKVLRGEFDLLKELTDPKRIFEMFRSDCNEIVEKYRKGEINKDEAKRNFFLLKSYALTQLQIHFERLKKLAREKGIEIEAKLEPELINKIALMIDEMENL